MESKDIVPAFVTHREAWAGRENAILTKFALVGGGFRIKPSTK
jgi:hypothetical protein